VTFRGTVRTLRSSTRTAVRAALERILRGVGEAQGVRIELSYQEGYDAVVNDPEAAALVEAAARREVGEEALARVNPVMGGEDFSAYLAAAPGAFFFVGTRNDDPATAVPHHHPRFAIDEAALRTGIAVLTRTALDVLAD
jgi:amidohydrolase